jgi:galactokinase/mevalonate kinase-like predicted kinase
VAGPDELGPAAAAYPGDVDANTLPIGKQDQYIAAYGGIRDIRFGPGDEAGASGAKLTGAGGGGFLLVIRPVERQYAVRESLADMREISAGLDRRGSRIVLNVQRDI